MRKYILSLLALVSLLSAMAKTTYIPKYRSYIHIVNGSDTVAVSSSMMDLSLADESGLFNIAILHEDVTKEKVKAIKRAKRIAGWATFSAVMSGVSTAFSNNSLEYMVRSTNTRIAGQLADIYNANAKEEQKLKIEMWIENTTDKELMVNDMERGLIWFIRPRQSMTIYMNNPEAAQLRISDLGSNTVRYVSALAGSMVKKWEIGMEDDDFWIVAECEGNEYDYAIEGYKWISKTDYSERDMTIDEYRAFVKEYKNNHNK